MKTKNVIFGVLVFLIVLFGLSFILSKGDKTHSSPPPSPVQPGEFLIGAFNIAHDHNYYIYRDDLHFNLWSNYINGCYDTLIGADTFPIPRGWQYIDASCGGDYMQNPIGDYSADVIRVIERNYNTHGYRSLISRPKIEYLVRGQRSIYQCENSTNISSEKWYRFDGSETGHDVPDENGTIWAKICEPGVDLANAYVVKDIHIKSEQVGYNGKHDLSNDNFRYWYIKPKIKIDKSGIPPNTPVCTIEVWKFAYSDYPLINVALNSNDFVSNVYKEEFTSIPSIKGDSLKPDDPADTNHFDIRIKWLGNCSMWLDYVKVDCQVADKLFNSNPQYNYNQWISDESSQIGGANGAYRFWVDEPEYNMLPGVKYVQDKIVNVYNPGSSLMTTEYSCYHGPTGTNPNNYDQLSYADYKIKQESMNVPEILTAVYPFYGHTKIPNALQSSPYDSSKGFLGEPAGISAYESEIQLLFDRTLIGEEEGVKKGLRYPVKYLKEPTTPEKPFYFTPQVLMEYYNPGLQNREPTTEEQEAMVDIAVSYGAKGIIYYEYISWGNFKFPDDTYARGIVESDWETPRRQNIYGENKWNKLCSLNLKLKTWGPKLMDFSIKNTTSYSYRLSDQRSELTGSTYINQLKTYTPGIGVPDTNINTNNLTPDQPENTYLQASVLNVSNPTSYIKYFMIVNRRCWPYNNNTSSDNIGGRRIVTIKFNPNSLSSFNNWNIIDLSNNTIVKTFDKNSNSEVNLGAYLPGEGKLYKLVPVMVTGGTFITDESISTTFNCDSTVYNNGYNLTVRCGTNISFSSKGKIVMNGGSFNCSYIPDGPTPDPCAMVNFQGKSGAQWEGISFTGCNAVNVEKINFSNIAYEPSTIQNCAISINNCFDFFIGGCTFNQTNQSNGVNLIFYSVLGEPSWRNSYIYGCTFNVSNSSSIPINAVAIGLSSAPVKVFYNVFNDNSSGGCPYAVLLEGVTGGIVQNNSIYNFPVGVNALSSSADFFNNTIYSNRASSVGFKGLSGSTLNLIPVANYLTGGFNKITSVNTGSKNIDVDNSYFDIDNGYNIFNLSYNHRNDSYHLYGTFNRELNSDNPVPARLNCFQLDTVPVQSYSLEPIRDVKWSGNETVVFNFLSYSCNVGLPDNYEIFSEEGILNDTIYLLGGGNGGGIPNVQLSTSNVKFKNITKALYNLPLSVFDLMMSVGGKESEVQTYNYKAAYDSVCINLRKRNYLFVVEQSKYLLTNYPDSIKSIDLIPKLYHASLSLDSNGNVISPLKTFYETLIQNNSGNAPLLTRAFYFIQKCKAALKQYPSALQGFSTIIQQNPYSYEGLVASWDYAATYLLDSLSGHGGSSNDQLLQDNVQLNKQEEVDMEILFDRAFSDLDSTKFSKTDRKVIKQNITEAMTSSRKSQINKVESLQKKVDEGIKVAKTELKQLKALNETIKPKKPNTILELKKVVLNDIKKVFSKEDNSDNVKKVEIPLNYNLSQNYPNPFNPVTKINYELPKDGKVKLVIFDILGRQIKSLVNNEFKTAGRYTVEFNGSQFASGVYFYRIQVEGGNGYTAVKKMVMVK